MNNSIIQPARASKRERPEGAQMNFLFIQLRFAMPIDD
jgi:hypothetical protein